MDTLPQRPLLSSESSLQAFNVVELFRSTGEREFPAQLMSVFLWIAAHDGCKQEWLPEAVTMSASSVSRCVTWLGPQHRLEHRSGLKLVRRERDPDNYKAYRLYLTPKGKSFVKLIDGFLSSSIDLTTAKTDLSSHDDDQNLG